jgi:Domain of unknown function (DU1801)
MAELKTKKTRAPVDAFIRSIPDDTVRADCVRLVELMTTATGSPPAMWGSSVVGFGDYHYISEKTGREGDWFVVGFSPRKQNLTLYFSSGFFEGTDEMRNRLGKHTVGKGCLYVKRLADVDQAVLVELLNRSVEATRRSAG